MKPPDYVEQVLGRAYRHLGGPRLLHRYGMKRPGLRRGRWVPALGVARDGRLIGPLNWFGRLLVRIGRRRR